MAAYNYNCHWPPNWKLEDCRQQLFRDGLHPNQFKWESVFPAPYQLHWVSTCTEELLRVKPKKWELAPKWTPPKLFYAPVIN